MIEIQNINKSFNDFQVLQDINLKIEDQSVLGLVGINGAGKSTLLRILTGVFEADCGTILIDGQNHFDNEVIKKNIFFLSDEPYFDHNSTPRSIVKLYQAMYDLDIDAYFNYLKNFDLPADKKLSKLSKGMKRQVFLSIAFAIHPKYLVLDEAFDGLDPLSRLKFKKEIIKLMEEYHTTIIISSHSLRELEDICDNFALLNNKTISSSGNLIDKLGELHKYQIAFKKEIKPEEFPDIYQSITNEGRIIKIITPSNIDEVNEKIKDLEPLLIDELSIDFEELFTTLVKSEGYIQ